MENWIGYLVFPQEVNRLIGDLEQRISQLRQQADWQAAKAYLQSASYVRAQPILKGLITDNAVIGAGTRVDLRLLYDLCGSMERAPDGVQIVIRQLTEGQEGEAFETALKLYAFYVSKDPSPQI